MVVHVVLFRPRPQLDGAARQGLADAFAQAVADIPAIRSARVGQRVTHGGSYEPQMRQDFTHAAILEFATVDDLKGYLTHPAHEVLGRLFFECFEEALMYDYEVWDGREGLSRLL
jgi:hypothetical protein